MMPVSANPLLNIAVAHKNEHLKQILQLQQRYHRDSVHPDKQSSNGFLYTRYTLAFLQQMSTASPQFIALFNDRVVGYNLSLSAELVRITPHLKSMFAAFEQTHYKERLLNSYSYVIGGQVCVDEVFRGQGLLSKMYTAVKASLQKQYQLCVTDVSHRNQPSLYAHLKTGFEVVNTYPYDGEMWHTVVWNWQH